MTTPPDNIDFSGTAANNIAINPLVEKIDAILPQTQCGQCGYAGCKPYAVALARGETDINQCPPGGDEGIRELSVLLGRPYKPLSAIHGVEKPKCVALIDERICIGCTLCIEACPVDAIVGATKQMHTVIASLCTGCELCLPPCPVDCISLEALTPEQQAWQRKEKRTIADAARKRHEFRQYRIARDEREKEARLTARFVAHKTNAVTEVASSANGNST